MAAFNSFRSEIWVLNDVYVSNFGTNPTVGNQSGPVTLAFDAGKVTSNLIAYDAAGKLDSKGSKSKSINFIAPPTSTPLGVITGVSTNSVVEINTPSRFTDEQEAFSTLRYSVSVVSGSNLFDSVSLNSLNRLVLDYKAGQGGLAQIRVDATDSFGLVGSLLVDVAIDADGIGAAPAGTSLPVTTAEDTTYTITAADFGFTDPNDFPANTFAAVTVTNLPVKGSLTLNNAPVTANQTIAIGNISAGQLKYTPVTNENGNAYSSFQFQVRDNGNGNNVDLSPNTLTFNVTPVNDAPVVGAGSAFVTMPAIAEDTTSPAGVLLSDLAPLITDADAGALKGIAVIFANNATGNWQYALDGTTFQNFDSVSNATARLLALETTRIRFVPNLNFNTPVGNAGVELHFVAWDRTVGSVGGTIEVPTLGGRGGTTGFSESPGVYTQFVTPVNDAPTLNTANVSLPNINEDTANPAGALVSQLLTGMSDVDAGAVRGMAVRSVQNTNGAWQYSLNGGTTWTPFGSVSAATARLLPSNATTRVRFVADANFAGNRGFSFYAWDQTSGTAGDTVDLSSSGDKGGTTAFSTDIELTFATLVINAINDAPVISVPAALTLTVNTPLVFSTANGNALSVSDVDVNTRSESIEVQFTASKGRFALSSLAGITITLGTNASAGFTIRGSVASINAALSGAVFIPNADAFGAGFLRLIVNDLGNLGAGNPFTRSQTTAITIDPLPVATDLGTLNFSTPSAFNAGTLTAGRTTSIFYSLTVAQAADVRMVLSGLSVNADLFVASTSGLPLTSSIDAGTTVEDLVFTVFSPGSYIIRVKPLVAPTVNSSFNLSVSRSLTTDDLLVNATALGTLAAATLPTVRRSDSAGGTGDVQDYYKFTTTVASGFRLNLSGLTDDLDLQLLSNKGVVLRSSVLGLTSIENIVFSTLAAGDYIIRVFAQPNRVLSDYDLSASVVISADDSILLASALGTPNASTLPVLRRTGSVGGNTDVQDYVSFVLAASTDVRVNLTGLSADLDAQLLDRFGRSVAVGSNNGNQAENFLATSLAAGTYYVRIAGLGSAASAYELSIAINSASDDLLSNAVSLGGLTATTLTLQRTGDANSVSDVIDYYQFTLESLSDVRVNLSGMSTDADITLEDSFGRTISSSVFSGNTIDNMGATALAAGTYFIRVRAFSTSTNYLLTVSRVTTSDDLISNATVLPTLTSGTLPTVRTSGAAGGSDIQDYYRFDLTTAGNLRFAVSNLTTDLDVQLLDQFGQVIIAGTQSGNTIERVLTPALAVGTYYIRVFQQIGGGPVSNYNLEVTTDFNGDDIIGPRTNLGTLAAVPLTASGSVGGAADIQDYFSFTLTSTRNVRFQLTGLTADIDIQVLDSFGQLVPFGSGSNGGSTSEDITLNGLLAGNYFIRIFPFQTAGSNYSLSVT